MAGVYGDLRTPHVADAVAGQDVKDSTYKNWELAVRLGRSPSQSAV